MKTICCRNAAEKCGNSEKNRKKMEDRVMTCNRCYGVVVNNLLMYVIMKITRNRCCFHVIEINLKRQRFYVLILQ